MRKAVLYAVVPVLLVPAIPAAWYSFSKPSADQLSIALRSMGFLPIYPPSNLMSLGSLYYVDPEVKSFKTICHAEADDLKGAVVESPSAKLVADELYSGEFASGIKIQTGSDSHGDAAKRYTQRVHYSLSDVRVFEIPLGQNRKIFDKLMAKQECNDAVMESIQAGGYVCQGQQILEATAEIRLRMDDRTTADAKANVDVEEVKDAVKAAVETQANVNLVEKEGKVMTGSSLKFGVSMNPTCLAPPHARFARKLPKTTFGRFTNFVMYWMIEPVLPRG